MKKLINVILALVSIWAALTIAVLLHEWTHGLLNWIFGFKSSPFAIYYGGTSWLNLLFYANIDDMTPYTTIVTMGHPYQAGIIAIVPPILVNGLLALLSGLYLSYSKQPRPWLTWFLFWFYLINLQEFFSYTVQRAFSYHADVGLFIQYFHLSPWWVFIPGFYLSVYGIHLAFKKYLPLVFFRWQIHSSLIKIMLLCATTFVLLILSSIRAISPHFNPVVQMIAYLSLLFIPFCLVAYGDV